MHMLCRLHSFWILVWKMVWKSRQSFNRDALVLFRALCLKGWYLRSVQPICFGRLRAHHFRHIVYYLHTCLAQVSVIMRVTGFLLLCVAVTADSPTEDYYLLSDALKEDAALRRRLHLQRLVHTYVGSPSCVPPRHEVVIGQKLTLSNYPHQSVATLIVCNLT